MANYSSQPLEAIVVLNLEEISVGGRSCAPAKKDHLRWVELLLNIGILRKVEPLGKHHVESIQLPFDEIAHREMQMPKRARGVPGAGFEGVSGVVAVRPDKEEFGSGCGHESPNVPQCFLKFYLLVHSWSRRPRA